MIKSGSLLFSIGYFLGFLLVICGGSVQLFLRPLSEGVEGFKTKSAIFGISIEPEIDTLFQTSNISARLKYMATISPNWLPLA